MDDSDIAKAASRGVANAAIALVPQLRYKTLRSENSPYCAFVMLLPMRLNRPVGQGFHPKTQCPTRCALRPVRWMEKSKHAPHRVLQCRSNRPNHEDALAIRF